MILTLALATALLLLGEQQSAPLKEQVYILSQSEGRGDYLSAPDETGPNTRTAWSWSVSSTPDGSPLIDAFLNEYDCETSRFRRIRQERYRADQLYDTRISDAGFRSPHSLEMEWRIVREICRGGYQALPQVENIALAAAGLSSARS